MAPVNAHKAITFFIPFSLFRSARWDACQSKNFVIFKKGVRFDLLSIPTSALSASGKKGMISASTNEPAPLDKPLWQIGRKDTKKKCGSQV
jgi:hypothetical protein